ncbi:MAG: sulfur carrier protein ThiS [Pseudomonadota bacterium]|nr:sulfur carrier protein ThiS [Pseudomonadota bacterium]
MKQILLNGQPYQTQANFIGELIDELELNGKRIAIELNQQLIPKSRHLSTSIDEQSKIEVVHAVGGG